MNHRRFRLGIALAMGALAVVSAAQGPIAPAAAGLELTVTRFLETADQYSRTFGNLTVEETRVLEEFDESGRTGKRRVIVGDLVVYRSARSDATGSVAAEYRDARLVDGKAVAQRDKRALDLITRATSSASLAEELRRINQESQRYDFNRHFGPFTIYQVPRATMRDDFRFNLVGPAQVNGHDVVEVEYREVVPRPATWAGIESMYTKMGIIKFFERGRLWLDAATSQLRRGRWEIAGVHPSLREPIQLVGYESTYVESRFGILVPERIVVDWYENRKSKATPVFALAARTTFTYGAFKQFGVTTDADVVTPAGR